MPINSMLGLGWCIVAQAVQPVESEIAQTSIVIAALAIVCNFTLNMVDRFRAYQRSRNGGERDRPGNATTCIQHIAKLAVLEERQNRLIAKVDKLCNKGD